MVKMPQISSAKYTRDTEVMKGREKGEKETLECQVLTQKISESFPYQVKYGITVQNIGKKLKIAG